VAGVPGVLGQHVLVLNKLCYTIKVDGGGSAWSPWSACSVTCGNGIRRRSRTCNNPARAYRGLPCRGRSIRTRLCNIMTCAGKFVRSD